MDISVIVPSLNEEENIRECLRSIKEQKTHFSYELIVSDGGSKDATIEIAEKEADKVVHSETGIAKGRNEGAKTAKGKNLVFIDSDSSIPSNYLDSVIPILEDDTIAGISNCFRFSKRTKHLKMIERICNNYLMLKGLAGKAEMLGFNTVVRKTTFEKIGGFPNTPLEDNSFKLRLMKTGRTVCLPEPKAITSERRINEDGALKTLLYYSNLKIMSELPEIPIKKILGGKDYVPIR